VLLIAIAVTVISCTHSPQVSTPALPATVSFKNDIIPVFTAYCLGSGCHSSPNAAANLDLTDSVAYVQLFHKNDIDTINPPNSFLYETMNTTGTPMPPSGRLSNYDVAIVLKWIQQGAKNN